MRTIKAEKLTREAFWEFGSYVNITEPEGNNLGDFFNDKGLLSVSGTMPVAFSPLLLHKADQMIVTAAEFHNTTGEGIVAMDDDIVVHVAPPTGKPAPELTRAFIVPKGTMVILKTGVWHYGGFPLHNKVAHVLIVLPERIYKTDCYVTEYDEKDRIKIEL
jgi:ureidoglycolate lyase